MKPCHPTGATYCSRCGYTNELREAIDCLSDIPGTEDYLDIVREAEAALQWIVESDAEGPYGEHARHALMGWCPCGESVEAHRALDGDCPRWHA